MTQADLFGDLRRLKTLFNALSDFSLFGCVGLDLRFEMLGLWYSTDNLFEYSY